MLKITGIFLMALGWISIFMVMLVPSMFNDFDQPDHLVMMALITVIAGASHCALDLLLGLKGGKYGGDTALKRSVDLTYYMVESCWSHDECVNRFGDEDSMCKTGTTTERGCKECMCRYFKSGRQ